MDRRSFLKKAAVVPLAGGAVCAFGASSHGPTGIDLPERCECGGVLRMLDADGANDNNVDPDVGMARLRVRQYCERCGVVCVSKIGVRYRRMVVDYSPTGTVLPFPEPPEGE